MYEYAIEPIPVLDVANLSWLTDIYLVHSGRRYKLDAGQCSKCKSNKVLQLYTEELVTPLFHHTEVLHGRIKGRCEEHLLTDGLEENVEIPVYVMPANDRSIVQIHAAIRLAMNSTYGSASSYNRKSFDPAMGDKIIFDYTKMEWNGC